MAFTPKLGKKVEKGMPTAFAPALGQGTGTQVNATSAPVVPTTTTQSYYDTRSANMQGAANTLGNVAVGAAKEVGSFLKGFGTLTQSVLDQTAGRVVSAAQGKGFTPTTATPGNIFNVSRPGTAESQAVDQALTPEGTAQKVGAFGAQVAEFAVPGGAVTKATKALSFLPRIAVRAAGDAAVAGVRSGGNLSETTKAGVTSAALQTAVPVVGFTSRLLGSVLKGSAGALSMRGTDVIEQILKTPEAAQAGLRGPVTETLQKDARTVRRFIAAMRKGSNAAYGKALGELPETLKDPTSVMQGVKSQFNTLLQGRGVKIDPNKSALDFLETTLSRSEEGTLKTVFEDIDKWDNVSPAGLDKLAAKINAYKKPGDTSPQLNGILASLSKGVRDYIGKEVPAAKDMVERFTNEQNFLEELETHLSKVGRISSPIGLKNTAGRLQTLFTKNKEIAREVLEKIPGGSEILGKQAGRELQTQVARSTSSFGNIIAGLISAAIPPKVVGEIVAKTGIAANKIQPIIDALAELEPTARAAFLAALLEQSSPESPN